MNSLNNSGTIVNNIANKNYTDYRCINPLATVIGEPWFPMNDVCPCNPKLSGPTGRGYSGCPFGVQFPDTIDSPNESNGLVPLSSLRAINGQWVPERVQDLPLGAAYPTLSYVPPQLQPRANVRIGVTWRS